MRGKELDNLGKGLDNLGKGLDNLGNTCFLNAAIQALKNSSTFTNLITSIKVINADGSKKCTLQHLQDIILNFQDPNDRKPFLVPTELVDSFYSINKSFRRGEQQCVVEFFEYFFDILEADFQSKMFRVDNRCL